MHLDRDARRIAVADRQRGDDAHGHGPRLRSRSTIADYDAPPMSGETFGRDRESAPFWEHETARYAEQMRATRAPYHDARLLTARRLIDAAALPAGARIIDFGCGDGVFAWQLANDGYVVHGTDIATAMIDIARDGAPAGATFAVGSAHTLADVGPCEALMALNVLAYLTDDELAAFWEAARLIVGSGGWLVLSHSNELFDLFALNDGTVGFFARHFDADVSSLLGPERAERPTYNVRANPLSYAGELEREGFTEVRQAFFNLHPRPPALLGGYPDDGRVVDPDRIAAVAPWKQMLQCSTYFSLARRAG
jgi:SAM-dependent methyltransferase